MNEAPGRAEREGAVWDNDWGDDWWCPGIVAVVTCLLALAGLVLAAFLWGLYCQ